MSDYAKRWSTGDAYVRYVGRWSMLVGRAFLDWMGVAPGGRWLDVGCGTGTLASLVLASESPESIVGVDPSAGFIAYARENVLNERANFEVGDARSLPFGEAEFDAVVSGLVLNFVPPAQQRDAASELVRVCRSRGTVAAYVWDYADGQQMMRYFWETAGDLDPAAGKIAEAVLFPLCHPEPLAALFAGAGLEQVETRAIEVPTVFADFDDYWTPFLEGEAPAPAYARSLSESGRDRLREELRQRLPIADDGSISLVARAWAVRGIKPE